MVGHHFRELHGVHEYLLSVVISLRSSGNRSRHDDAVSLALDCHLVFNTPSVSDRHPSNQCHHNFDWHCISHGSIPTPSKCFVERNGTQLSFSPRLCFDDSIYRQCWVQPPSAHQSATHEWWRFDRNFSHLAADYFTSSSLDHWYSMGRDHIILCNAAAPYLLLVLHAPLIIRHWANHFIIRITIFGCICLHIVGRSRYHQPNRGGLFNYSSCHPFQHFAVSTSWTIPTNAPIKY